MHGKMASDIESSASMHGDRQETSRYIPRMVFWETTNACNLKCIHCRACPAEQRSPEELTTAESKTLLDQIASFSSPAVVLSGGEPLVRPDILEIARYGTDKGLRMLLATNGTLLTPELAQQIKDAGIQRVSVSIDGAMAETHDSFRRIPGAFDAAWRGVEYLKEAGIPFQINTTVAKHNIDQIPDILNLVIEKGAVALHIFLLVPTGCGKEIADDEMIDPMEYERVLNWFYDRSRDVPIALKATCAPHYFRIIRQRAKEEGIPPPVSGHGHESMTKGCLAGSAVCFISHKGEVFPCGYLQISAGNVRQQTFEDVWTNAEVFKALRNEDNLEGKCGYCEYRRVCMGCRARAYAYTGNYLSAEPYCVYEPVKVQAKSDG
ncbi:MAG: heme b synthase [Armatimonadota bacterium]